MSPQACRVKANHSFHIHKEVLGILQPGLRFCFGCEGPNLLREGFLDPHVSRIFGCRGSRGVQANVQRGLLLLHFVRTADSFADFLMASDAVI